MALNLYESVLEYRSDLGKLVPALIDAVPKQTAAGDFLLRPKDSICFHDETILEARDIWYSLRRMLVAEQRNANLWLDVLLGTRANSAARDEVAEALGRITLEGDVVRVSLGRPFPPFPYFLARWSPVMSQRWAVAAGEWPGDVDQLDEFLFQPSSATDRAANGTGAFRLESWDDASHSVRLVRHEHYWGEPAVASSCLLVCDDDEGLRAESLMAGDADFSVCHPSQRRMLDAAESVRVQEMPEQWDVNPLGCICQSLDPGAEALGSGEFDGDGIPRDALSDRDLRLSLAYAFDYERFVREGLHGFALNHWGPFPLPSFDEGPRPAYRFDLAQAGEHLRKAWEGAAADGGFRLQVFTHKANAVRMTAAEILRDGFNSLSPKCVIEVVPVSFEELSLAIFSSRAPVAWTGWDAAYQHRHAFAQELMGSGALLPRALGIPTEQVGHLFARALSEDADAAQEAYFDLGRLAIEESWFLFVPGKVSFLPISTRWDSVRLKSGITNVLDFASFKPRAKESFVESVLV